MSPFLARAGRWASPNEVGPAVQMAQADGFVFGTTKPTTANTGAVTARVALQRLNGVQTTSYPGQIIERALIDQGRIIVRHPNVIIRDCVIVMPASDAQISAVLAVTSGASARVERVTVEVPTANRSYKVAHGIQGSGIVSVRNQISGTVDGFSKVGFNQRSYFEDYGSLVYDLAYDPNDPGHNPPGTHNDASQDAGELSHVITVGSVLATGSTSSVLITRDHLDGWYGSGPIYDQCWFPVGDPTFGSIFNVKASMTPIPGLTLTRCRFPRTYPTKARIYAPPEHLAVMRITSHGPMRNVFDDASALDPYPPDADIVPVYRGPGVSPNNLLTYGSEVGL